MPHHKGPRATCQTEPYWQILLRTLRMSHQTGLMITRYWIRASQTLRHRNHLLLLLSLRRSERHLHTLRKLTRINLLRIQCLQLHVDLRHNLLENYYLGQDYRQYLKNPTSDLPRCRGQHRTCTNQLLMIHLQLCSLDVSGVCPRHKTSSVR